MARILIVDDDPSMREALRFILEHGGHEVIEAGDGRAGLAEHKKSVFDLVITDLVMPHMDGIETIMALKKGSPTLKIIAISAGGVGKAADYLAMAGHLGASRTIAKPFTADELALVVQEVLGTEAAGPKTTDHPPSP